MIFFVVLSLAALSAAESDNHTQEIPFQVEEQPHPHPQAQQVAEDVNVIPVYKPIYKPYSVEAHYTLSPTFINWLNYYLQKSGYYQHRPHYNLKPYPDVYQEMYNDDALLEYISGYQPVDDVSQYLNYIQRYPYVNAYNKSPALERSWEQTDNDKSRDLENIGVFGKKLNVDDNIGFNNDDFEMEGNVPYSINSKRPISNIGRTGHPIGLITSYQVPHDSQHWFPRTIDFGKNQAPLETNFGKVYTTETMRKFFGKDLNQDNTILIKSDNLDLEDSYIPVPKDQEELSRTRYPGWRPGVHHLQ